MLVNMVAAGGEIQFWFLQRHPSCKVTRLFKTIAPIMSNRNVLPEDILDMIGDLSSILGSQEFYPFQLDTLWGHMSRCVLHSP